MKPIGPNTNQYDKTLNPFEDLSSLPRSENIDPPPGFCEQPADNQNNDHLNPSDSWFDSFLDKKIGLGSANNADPMQAGSIVNDTSKANQNTIYRYSKSI